MDYRSRPDDDVEDLKAVLLEFSCHFIFGDLSSLITKLFIFHTFPPYCSIYSRVAYVFCFCVIKNIYLSSLHRIFNISSLPCLPILIKVELYHFPEGRARQKRELRIWCGIECYE